MNKKQLMLVLAGLSVISNIQSSDNQIATPSYWATGTAAMSKGLNYAVDAVKGLPATAKAHPYISGAAGIGAVGGLAYLAYTKRNLIKNGLSKAANVVKGLGTTIKENKVKTALVATGIAAAGAGLYFKGLPAVITENKMLVAAATASQGLIYGTVLATSAPVVSTPAATANALPVPVVSTPVVSTPVVSVNHGKRIVRHGKTVKKHGKKAHGKKAKKGHGKRK